MIILFYVLDCAILIGLTWLLVRTFHRASIKRIIIPTLCLKLLAGIGMGLLYKYYYDGGDTFSYFKEAVKLSTLAGKDFSAYSRFLFFNEGIGAEQVHYSGQPRALFMVKLVSLINLLTYDNYWFSSIFFSFFSFSGLFLLAERLTSVYPSKKMAIVFSLLLFPSVIFWSSGIIKESIAIGAMGFLLASFLGYICHQKKYALHFFLVDALMIFLLWNTKYYYAGALLLLMMAIIFTITLRNKISFIASSWIYQVITYGFLCVFFLLLASMSHPNFYLNRIMSVIAENHRAFVEKSDPQDIIHYHEFQANVSSLLRNAPKALFSGLFRPFIGESTTIVKLLAGAENLVILILAVTALFGVPKKISLVHRLLLISALLYCLAMSTFLALSAPNFGTLIRYKVGFLPLFLLIITISNPLIERLNALVK